MSIGLLIVRLVVGLTLAAHGAQKLFGWFGGGGIAGTGAGLEHLGFRPGRVQAALAGVIEVGGGLFVAAGLLTPAAAASVVAVMIVAAVSAHLRNGFFAQNGGFEYAFVLGAVALGLAFTGPGSLSVDHALGLSLSGLTWGTAALIAGLVGGTVPLATRQRAAQPAA
jgi:putative oxidoreductase